MPRAFPAVVMMTLFAVAAGASCSGSAQEDHALLELAPRGSAVDTPGTVRTSAAAQVPLPPVADSVAREVELIAINHQRERRTSSSRSDEILFDPRIRGSGEWLAVRPHAKELASLLGIQLAKPAEYLRCPDEPLGQGCELPKVRMVLALGPARVPGDIATITLYGWQPGRRGGVARSTVTWEMRREGARWVVKDVLAEAAH